MKTMYAAKLTTLKHAHTQDYHQKTKEAKVKWQALELDWWLPSQGAQNKSHP